MIVVIVFLMFLRIIIILGRCSNFVLIEERNLVLVALRDHYFGLAGYDLTTLNLLLLQLGGQIGGKCAAVCRLKHGSRPVSRRLLRCRSPSILVVASVA